MHQNTEVSDHTNNAAAASPGGAGSAPIALTTESVFTADAGSTDEVTDENLYLPMITAAALQERFLLAAKKLQECLQFDTHLCPEDIFRFKR